MSESASGNNGVGSIVDPGLSCAAGGEGNYRDYLLSTTVPGGVLSSLPGNLRANLDVQHNGPEQPGTSKSEAFLLGNVSQATFSNQRGTVQLELSSGTCANPTLLFTNSTNVSGPGTWVIDPTSAGNTGSYRKASGSGTFTLNAGVEPGSRQPAELGADRQRHRARAVAVDQRGERVLGESRSRLRAA